MSAASDDLRRSRGPRRSPMVAMSALITALALGSGVTEPALAAGPDIYVLVGGPIESNGTGTVDITVGNGGTTSTNVNFSAILRVSTPLGAVPGCELSKDFLTPDPLPGTQKKMFRVTFHYPVRLPAQVEPNRLITYSIFADTRPWSGTWGPTNGALDTNTTNNSGQNTFKAPAGTVTCRPL
jgi:hypothetical protein